MTAKKLSIIIIIVIAVLLILAFLPIWCNTYYLPDRAAEGVIEKTHCGPIFGIFKTY